MKDQERWKEFGRVLRRIGLIEWRLNNVVGWIIVALVILYGLSRLF